uniref:Uncharacterized protein n=1 Tax=Ananas comosus var. bracteatus TaxID=296719 RepID=A0A6V7NPG6_ANACO|nr:unnamed protein product [Ananas comosus var. bracteatus]
MAEFAHNNSYQESIAVTHWTFTNCEVRVIRCALSFSRFPGRSLTVFRPMARVPRSVVQSLAPKSKNLDFGQLSDWLSGGLVPVQGCACTGTEPRTRKPEPRVCIFAGLVPVQGWSCTGTMLMVVPVQPSGLYPPTPLGHSPELGRAENQLGAWVWSLIERRYLKFEDFELVLRLLRVIIAIIIVLTLFFSGLVVHRAEVSNCPLGTINYSSRALSLSMFFRAFRAG